MQRIVAGVSSALVDSMIGCLNKFNSYRSLFFLKEISTKTIRILVRNFIANRARILIIK